jgi:hypothetical protein
MPAKEYFSPCSDNEGFEMVFDVKIERINFDGCFEILKHLN